jgi:hypothetical protein
MAWLAAAVLTLLLALPAHAQIHVDIGIHLPAPPRLVIVPEVRAVQYVPTVNANLFFYGNQYWAFHGGSWHVSSGHAGPWIVVAPQVVPRPVLMVPVEYYRVPPGHWKSWHKKKAPRWHDDWGHEWAEKRQWKHDRDDDDRGRGKGKGHGKGKKDRD